MIKRKKTRKRDRKHQRSIVSATAMSKRDRERATVWKRGTEVDSEIEGNKEHISTQIDWYWKFKTLLLCVPTQFFFPILLPNVSLCTWLLVCHRSGQPVLLLQQCILPEYVRCLSSWICLPFGECVTNHMCRWFLHEPVGVHFISFACFLFAYDLFHSVDFRLKL